MNILLDGMFYNGHGFAEGNRILLRILDQAGYRVRILARDRAEKQLVLSAAEIGYIASFEQTRLTGNDVYFCNQVGSDVRARPDFRVNIARTTFETDRIPDFWIPELNRFDELWLQCSFNLVSFRGSGVHVPLVLMPNFFDVGEYDPEGERLPLPASESFLFLSVFDLQQRKGYDVLLEAFLNEFGPEDSVGLVVKVRGENDAAKLEAIISGHPKARKEKPPVYIIGQMLSVQELRSLYRACDAFVLPTRGEGWGRPFFEAMLMELPAIGTNWSGQTEFMREGNSYLVDVERLIRIENNEHSMFNGHYWAEPSLGDLQKKMRYVAEHRQEAKATGRAARKQLLEQYSLDLLTERVVKALNKYG
ncbi:glycosyltransferase family 4 protein [Paenibacillus ginsengarvi]|uniref:Glycosyltransferase n=1 Tax=Paenibacillus ginsengarvi TaxID=400777 RepID=A0A3B0CJZ8_9BACL|nr:glycosyltransferase family 4 protein [Paenibacillus ginsengarvi]RKN85330.1 glycosyltransferase [Paenibacillus ginsengarvi]